MKILIRVDASTFMGTGHVMRCLTLARALRDCGASVHFACREWGGNLIRSITNLGFPVYNLTPPDLLDHDLAGGETEYDGWCGCPESMDAREVLDRGDGGRWDWVVVDHYGLGVEWHRAVRSRAHRLMAIDDLARHHEVDLLLDQNWTGPEPSIRYQGRVPESCQLLLGPRFALLQAEYATLAPLLPTRDGHVRRILVFFGADSSGLTRQTVSALSADDFRSLVLDVVVGPDYPECESLRSMVAARGNVRVHTGLPSLAGLIARADLAIGAGGVTTWERLCLGLPSVVITIAENQREPAEAMAAANLTILAGDKADVSADRLGSLVRELLQDAARLQSLSESGRALVDGRGCERVAGAMIEPDSTP